MTTNTIKFYEEIGDKQVKIGYAKYKLFDFELGDKYRKALDIVRSLTFTIGRNNLKRIAYITVFTIYEEYRNKGYGSKYIEKLCSMLEEDNYVVCICTRSIEKDYEKYLQKAMSNMCSPFITIGVLIKLELQDQSFFLEANGFKKIDSICFVEDDYEEPYVYVSKLSRPIIEYAIKENI